MKHLLTTRKHFEINDIPSYTFLYIVVLYRILFRITETL